MKYVVSSLLCASLGLGEAAAQQTVPPLKKEFLDSAWHVLSSAVGARYRRETEWRDSTAGEVRDYYLTGGLQAKGFFENVRKEIAHGVLETWYASGQLQSSAEFDHGKYNGEVREYYATGKLKRQEHYAANQLIDGRCLSPDGQPMECTPLVYVEVMPVYPEGDGGAQAIIAAVARNFQYPRKAIRSNVKGQVLVKFAVDEKGDVVDTQVTQTLSPEIDAAAIKAVQKLKRFQPGTQQGKPVKVHFTIPLNLAIN
jgi:protein TonB